MHTRSSRGKALALLLLTLLLAGGCGTRYVNRGDAPLPPSDGERSLLPEVSYRLDRAAWSPQPDCIALMPLRADGDRDKIELIRRTLYAHLAPKGYQLADLGRIDASLAGGGPDDSGRLARLARAVQCGYVMEGEVTDFELSFFAFYSSLKVGASLRLRRAGDGAVLWEATHVASLRDGGLPLSPLGAASGIFQASRNLSDEQAVGAIDSLARRLLASLPERLPAREGGTGKALPSWQGDVDRWLAGIPAADHESALIDLIGRDDLSPLQKETAFQRLATAFAKPRHWRQWAATRMVRKDVEGALDLLSQAAERWPDDAETWYLRARALALLNRSNEAEGSLLKAIARNGGNADYYEALAAVTLRRGKIGRSRAALEMALQIDAGRPGPWHKLALLDCNDGQYDSALETFATAGRLFAEAGHEDGLERVLSDMDGLKAEIGADAVLKRQAELQSLAASRRR